MSDWISNSIAALALAATIALTVWTNRKSAKTSEHQQALVDAQHRTNNMLAELALRLSETRQVQAGPSDEDLDVVTPVETAPDVRWIPEHVSKNTWLLRNLGTDAATSVAIDKESVGGVRVDFSPPLPADIGPGESLRILAIPAWGHPVKDEVKVTWAENESEIVPLPQWQ